jgi:serine/threonine protein kinase
MFSEEIIMKVLVQICLGLNCLHKLEIIPRDMKTSKIFLSDDYIVKIGDLNVSKLARPDSFDNVQAKTLFYASPEAWEEQPYNFKSDSWSLGCIIYEMACLHLPFQA